MSYVRPKSFSMASHKTVYLDIETTGLDIYGEDKPIGISVGVDTSDHVGNFRYFPIRHTVGENWKKDDVYRWLKAELKNKVIIGHNIGAFDLPALRQDGLNLIGNGNTFRDTLHAAIIHEPDAKSYTLDACAKRYLGDDQGKISGLDKTNLANIDPAIVGPYAEQDTRLCWMLDPVIHGFLRKKDLLGIYDLECRTVAPVVEMQSNGLFFDYEKAKSWISLAQRDLDFSKSVVGGINMNSPKQTQEACDRLWIVYPWNWKCPNAECEEAFPSFQHTDQEFWCWRCKVKMVKSSPHFGKKFLKNIDHPFVKSLLKAKQLHKLLNTFLIPWVENIDPTNPVLRYQLHQLRERDEEGSSSGAVSGRFSCSSVGSGAQPQQVWAVANQIEEIGPEYLLRSLFIPENGKRFLSIDASQIEFRLFAHYSENTQLIDAYKNDRSINFHKFVAEHVLQGKLPYKRAKNINFGTLYNMGVPKFAREMNISTKEATEMVATYDEAFPAAKELRNKMKRQAQTGVPTVTLYGRTFDWTDPAKRKKAYIALNRLIQGSAADLMKLALVKAYTGGYFSKMRLTVHDEIDGDIISDDAAVALKRDLEDPAFCDNKLSVPLLWENTIGDNWSGQ